MGLIIYTSNLSNPWPKFQGAIEELSSKKEVEIVNSLETLHSRLLQADSKGLVVVLVLSDREDLLKLIPIMNVLRKARVVLVLPDQEPETIKMGYKLEPRFICDIDSNISSVQAVLEHMV